MKSIFIFLMFVSLVSCSSNKANDQIKDYISKNINDPSAYEPVRFSDTAPDSTKYTDDGVINMLEDSIRQYQTLIDILRNGPPDKYLEVLNQQTAVLHKEHLYLTAYKNKPCGYKIEHVFRRKNKAGGIVLDSVNFRFDSAMNLRDMKYELNKD